MIDQALLDRLRTSRLSNEEEIGELAHQLKSVLGFEIHVTRRGLFTRGRVQSMSAVVGDVIFRVLITGGKPHFDTATSINGVAVSYTPATKEEFLASLASALQDATA